MSPLGDQLAVSGFLPGEGPFPIIQFIDTDPASATYNQEISDDFGVGQDPLDLAFSPDGTKLYMAALFGGGAIVMDARRDRSTYGDLTTIDDSFFDFGSVTRVAVSPDGSVVVLHGSFDAIESEGLFFIDATENPPVVVDTMEFQFMKDLVFHPTGDYLYLLKSGNTTVTVVNMVANTPNFRGIVNTINIDSPEPGSPAGNEPVSMAFFPDGQQALILGFDQAVDQPYIHTMDTSDPVNIIETAVQQPFAAGASSIRSSQIDVSPRGDRAVVYTSNAALYALDVTSPPYTLVGSHLPGGANSIVNMEFTIDGFGVYAADGTTDSMVVFDFSGVQSISLLSGDAQSGVVEQSLAAPLRVEISTLPLAASGPSRVAAMTDVEGVPVTFEFISGGGEIEGTRSSTRIVSTDQNGIAEVRVKLGPLVGNQVIRATTSGLGGSPIDFSAMAVVNSDTLPMTVSNLIPAPFSVDVSPTTAFQATFSRPVDTATVDLTSFFVLKASETEPIPGVHGYTDNDTRVSFTPSSPLAEGSDYTLTITGNVDDLNGGALTNPSTSTFATISTPLPLVLEAVDPPSAAAFVQVVLSGTGFGPTATLVLFNDVQVTPDAATIDAITATVPLTATSGNLRVVSGPDTTNAIPFTFLIPTPTPVTEVADSTETVVGVNNLVVNATGTWAWMVSPGGNAVVPLDIVNVVSEPAIPVGQNPIGIALLPDGSRAYVANRVSGDVTVIDTDPASGGFNTVITTIFNVGDGPLDIIVSPDGDRAIVASETSQDIAFIDTDPLSATFHEVLTRGGTGTRNKSLAIHPDGTILWVGTDDGYLTIDPVDFGVISRTGKGKSTKQLILNPDGGLLFVLTTEGEVLIIDVEPGSPSENEVITRTAKGSKKKSFSMNPDGTLLYIVQEENDIVIVVSIETIDGVSVFEPGSEVIPGVTATVVDTIDAGEDPSALAFVPDGTLALLTSPGDNSVIFLSLGPPKPVILADMKLRPKEIKVERKPKKKFKHIKAWIKLPLPYQAGDIDIASIRLNDVIPADLKKVKVKKKKKDGREELQIRFDRRKFNELLPLGNVVLAVVTGFVAAGDEAEEACFVAQTTIKVKHPKMVFPLGGEVLVAKRATTIRWISPDDTDVIQVDLHWSPGDTASWQEIASGLPDTGEYVWVTPNMYVEECQVAVTIYTAEDEVGSSITPIPFTIVAPVAVTLAGAGARIDARSAVIEWQTSFETGVRGFHVLRSDNELVAYQRVTQAMIASSGTRSGAEYEYRDGTIRPNRTYYYKLEEVPDSGPGQVFGPWEIRYKVDFALEQNYPNPFNPTTTIQFTVANDAHVRLIIYDVAGRRVRTLVDEPRRADHYEVKWDGKTNSGAPVASGVYFYRMTAGTFVKTKKMVMLK
ncbi:MAG: Ig-like domain-containing protein [bacterium]|nr:Ig-like domain-containing protein [bacterium]